MEIKYYKLNLETMQIEDEFIEVDENTILLQSNPIMEYEQEFQNEEIFTTQEALNFLLMGAMNIKSSLYKNTTSRGSGMGKYLANQIYRGKLDYDEVILRYPQFQTEIDEHLAYLTTKDGLKYK